MWRIVQLRLVSRMLSAWLSMSVTMVSGAEIWRFLRACEAPIALAVGLGFLIALRLRRGSSAVRSRRRAEKHARGGSVRRERPGWLSS
jgi:hypothetical protein